jgi:hypothetical protein
VAVHIYTQTLHRRTQITTEQHITTNVEEWGLCPVFASFTLALQLRKKDGKTSVRVRKTSVRLRKISVRFAVTQKRRIVAKWKCASGNICNLGSFEQNIKYLTSRRELSIGV